MTRTRMIWAYLALILLMMVVAGAITFVRGDLRPFDPKLTAGLSALTLMAVMRTLWAVLGVAVIAGFLLRRPPAVVLWIPVGTVLAVLVHLYAGEWLGLIRLERIGWLDAFLMYLPTVGLFSLLGGLLASVLPRG